MPDDLNPNPPVGGLAADQPLQEGPVAPLTPDPIPPVSLSPPSSSLPPEPPPLKPEEINTLAQDNPVSPESYGQSTTPPPPPLEASPSVPSFDEQPSQPVIVSAPPPKKSRKNIILTFLLVFLLLVSLPAAIYLVKQRQALQKKAAVSGGVQVCGIQIGPPRNEQAPSSANNGTYSINAPLWNTTTSSKKVKIEIGSFYCSEGKGNPPGKCDQNGHGSLSEVTIEAGKAYDQTLSAKQPGGSICGSYQVDLSVLAVDGNTSCNNESGSPMWGLWLTDSDCQTTTTTPTPTLICSKAGEACRNNTNDICCSGLNCNAKGNDAGICVIPTSTPTQTGTPTPKPTATPTPEPTSTLTPTQTPTPTTTPAVISKATATPTPVELPSAGFSAPTFGAILGGIIFLGLALLAF